VSNAIWSVIGILVLLHGYFMVRYQTYDPCGAAVARYHQDGRGAWPTQPDRSPKVLLACYYVALTGESPANMTTASKSK
jgi:hypothetical protein